MPRVYCHPTAPVRESTSCYQHNGPHALSIMLACIAAMLGVCAHLCPITLRCHAVCQLGSLYTLVLLQGGADGGRWAAGVTVLCTTMTLFS